VCKLTKSFYGLKQANRGWYERLTTLLLTYGFCPTYSNNSLFIKNNSHTFTMLLVYVDDIILARDSLVEFNNFKKILNDPLRSKTWVS